jgi:hypothetical protein
MAKREAILLWVVTAVSAASCGSATPTLTAISPAIVTSHLPAFALRVQGSHFAKGAAVVLDGRQLATSRIDDEELTAVVTPSDLGDAWNLSEGEPVRLDVLVRNPGREESAALPLTVSGHHTFRTSASLSAEASETTHSNPIILTSPEGAVHVQVSSFKEWRTDLFTFHSTDHGRVWSRPSRPFWDEMEFSSGISREESGALFQLVHGRAGIASFSRSTDGGLTWTSPRPIFPDPGTWNVPSSLGTIATPGRLHAFAGGEGEDILETRSTDQGRTWAVPTALPSSDRSPHLTLLRTVEGRVLALWWALVGKLPNHGSGVRQCLSGPGASIWGPVESASFNAEWPITESLGAVIDSRNTVHLASAFRGEPDLFITRSANLGGSWSAGRRIGMGFDDGSWHSNALKLLIDAVDTLTLVYSIERRLYYTRSTDRGLTWSTPTTVTSGPLAFSETDWDAAVDDEGYLHVVVCGLPSPTGPRFDSVNKVIYMSSRPD